MTTSYPGNQPNFPVHTDNNGEKISASDINNIQDTVSSVTQAIGSGIYQPMSKLLRRYWLAIGVISGYKNELAVSANGTAMQVTVDTGAANVLDSAFEHDSATNLTITAADPTNPRIDVVVVRLDWTANTIGLVVLQGTPAASPVAPSLTQTDGTRWEIALANVTVSAAATTIASGNVADKRTFSAGPTSTPTPGSTAQYDQNGGLSSTPGAGNVMTVNDQTVRSAFRAHKQAASQSISSFTATKVVFDAIDFDNLGEYNASTSTFTAKKKGLYLFSTSFQYNAPADGNYMIAELWKNGADDSRVFEMTPGAANSSSCTGSAVMMLNAGDSVSVYTYAGANLSISTSYIYDYFAGIQLA